MTPPKPLGRLSRPGAGDTADTPPDAAQAPRARRAGRAAKPAAMETPAEAAARVRAANAAARKANPGAPGPLERPSEAAARARAARAAAKAPAATDAGAAPPRAPVRGAAADRQIALLQHKVKTQAHQIAALRAKTLDLQRAIIADCPIRDFGDPMAAIAPVERRLVPGAQTTIFAFSGMITSFGMPPREFFGALSARPANIFFVKDFHQCWYQQGILGLSETIPDTVAALRGMIPPGQTRVVTIGTSAGGFGAILFGALMGCDLALAFSPQTQLDTQTVDTFKSSQSPETPEMLAEAAFKDLALVLETARPPFRVDLHYGTKHAKDTAAAQHLARFGNVRLIGHTLSAHSIAGSLKTSGKLQAILDQAVTG